MGSCSIFKIWGRYVDTVVDGRHRAYASWLAKKPEVKAFINYEQVEDITKLKLWTFDLFGFK